MPRKKLTDDERALQAYRRRAEREGIDLETSKLPSHYAMETERTRQELDRGRKGDKSRREADRRTVAR